MKLWMLTILILPCVLDRAESNCVSTPCTQTDYRSYSNCLSNQCPNAVVATGCPENKCSSVNCNTCSASHSNACCQTCCGSSSCECTSVNCNTCSNSNACCDTCCSRVSKCNCPSVNCNSCQGYGACCQSCCKQSDCCQSTNTQQCCNNNPNGNCCQSSPQPNPIRESEKIFLPTFPNITLPNITIIINQSAPIIHNNPHFSVNQSCPNYVTQGNSSLCVNVSTPTMPQQCCSMPSRQQECFPTNYPPYYQCPPVQQIMTCGPQCTQVQQPPSRLYQPIYIQPQPQPQPVIPIQQTPIYQQPIYQQPIIQQPIIQPQIYQPRMTGCYVSYQQTQCPQYCVGGCSFMPYGGSYTGGGQGCVPTTNFPYMRCPQYGYGYGYGGAGGNQPYIG